MKPVWLNHAIAQLQINSQLTSWTHNMQDTHGKNVVVTRKLCYRKYDCAMHPIYACHEKFQESLATPTTTFLKIVNGLLL